MNEEQAAKFDRLVSAHDDAIAANDHDAANAIAAEFEAEFFLPITDCY